MVAAVIRLNHVSDSRRSYQCIKFLVGLSNRSGLAKDNLLVTPSKWQWAVNWLKKKVCVVVAGVCCMVCGQPCGTIGWPKKKVLVVVAGVSAVWCGVVNPVVPLAG